MNPRSRTVGVGIACARMAAAAPLRRWSPDGRRSDEGQGVVDRHLGVVGDITGETRQRIRVRLEPLGVRNGFVIAVERADSGDESPLPHGRCRDRLRAYGRGGTLTQMVARRTP